MAGQHAAPPGALRTVICKPSGARALFDLTAAINWSNSIMQIASNVFQAVVALVAAWERAAGWVAGAAEGTIVGLALAVAAGWEEGWSPTRSVNKLAPAPALTRAPPEHEHTLPAVLDSRPDVKPQAAELSAAQPALPVAPRPSNKLASAEKMVRVARELGAENSAAGQWSTLSLHQVCSVTNEVPTRLPHPSHPAPRPLQGSGLHSMPRNHARPALASAPLAPAQGITAAAAPQRPADQTEQLDAPTTGARAAVTASRLGDPAQVRTSYNAGVCWRDVLAGCAGGIMQQSRKPTQNLNAPSFQLQEMIRTSSAPACPLLPAASVHRRLRRRRRARTAAARAAPCTRQ